MIDRTFCELLESRLAKAFANSSNGQLKGFWCDGILDENFESNVLPVVESPYSKKYLNDNRKMKLTAFAGQSGQDRYELTLLFGRKALSRYAKGLDISICVPDPISDACLEIDIINRTIAIQLY